MRPNKAFKKIVDHHCAVVQNAAALAQYLSKKAPQLLEGVSFQDILSHDESKLSNDLEASVYQGLYSGTLDWQSDVALQGVFHHVKGNKHHPEFWDPLCDAHRKMGAMFYASPFYTVQARQMTRSALFEMVCDWGAVEGGKALRQFAEKSVNRRWLFNLEQTNYIFALVDALGECE